MRAAALRGGRPHRAGGPSAAGSIAHGSRYAPAVSPTVARNRWRLAMRLTCAALSWSVGLVLAALLAPTYDGQTVSNSNGLTLTTRTAVQVHGLRALIIVAVPVAASLLVAVALYRRRTDGWRHGRAVA